MIECTVRCQILYDSIYSNIYQNIYYDTCIAQHICPKLPRMMLEYSCADSLAGAESHTKMLEILDPNLTLLRWRTSGIERSC